MKQRLFITILFLIVFIPAVILSVFAVRAVSQEEMVQRRRLEDALLIELDSTNTIIRFNLEQIIQELHETIPDAAALGAAQELPDDLWKSATPLAGTVYVLNPDGSIRYPDIDGSDAANLFYWRYLNLFSNKESIPVYQNIAQEYAGEILDIEEEHEPAEEASKKMRAEQPEAYAGSAVSPTVPAPAHASAPAHAPAAPAAADSADAAAGRSSVLRSKSALGLFESDSAVQERVYQKAEEEGVQPLVRNVLPDKEKAGTVVRSVYIESTKYFTEIIREKEYGIIPRLFDSSFMLLYWERQGDIITGCELDMDAVRARLSDAVQVPVNSVRYINILDHGGNTVIPAGNETAEKWRQPFVAKEISELLPYWETAILLRSPEEFQRQIETSRYYLSFLIFFLCLLIFIGMTAIYQFSSARLREVQQRVGFVTNVSHELKTPLTSIRMYSEMLADGSRKDPEKIRKYSSYIASESQRLTRLINNVLAFAKLEKGTKAFNPGIVDLNEIIKSLYDSVKEEIEYSGFSLILNLSDEPAMIKGDKEAVLQVLLNLLSNAQKYSRDEKYIEIRTEKTEGRASAEVIDSGTGIHRKFRKKIFKEFFRIDNTITSDTKGTGLGLSIAEKIMKQHGGEIVCSQRNADDYKSGSVFKMIFPAAAPPLPAGNGI